MTDEEAIAVDAMRAIGIESSLFQLRSFDAYLRARTEIMAKYLLPTRPELHEVYRVQLNHLETRLINDVNSARPDTQYELLWQAHRYEEGLRESRRREEIRLERERQFWANANERRVVE